MNVHATEARSVEYSPRKNPAVRDDHRDVGVQRPELGREVRCTHFGRLPDVETELESA